MKILRREISIYEFIYRRLQQLAKMFPGSRIEFHIKHPNGESWNYLSEGK